MSERESENGKAGRSKFGEDSEGCKRVKGFRGDLNKGFGGSGNKILVELIVKPLSTK